MTNIPIQIEPGVVRRHDDAPLPQRIIQGIAISPGKGFGRPCTYHTQEEPEKTMISDSVNEQQALFRGALEQVHENLGSLIRTAREHSDDEHMTIFQAHRMILEELQSDIIKSIKLQELTARDAVKQCFREYSDFFNGLEDNYLSQRAADFDELGQLLMNLLSNTSAYLGCREYTGCRTGECVLGNHHILVADELTAHVAIRIRPPTRGIVVEKCGINSHAALIARSLEIPVVSGIREPMRVIQHKDTLLVDGDSGTLIINPDEATLKSYINQVNLPHARHAVVEPLEGFRVLANLELAGQLDHALQTRADGIGLYRTEFEMLARDEVMNEQELVQSYTEVISRIQGKPVYFRLFDLGSDKSVPWLKLAPEENPALGCRGARLLLERPDLLQVQARALARVSQLAPVNVIYPMIATLDQFLQLKAIFLDAITDLDTGELHHGIMFEVPSACTNAKALYEAIDFGKIGTNDLMQYLYALDRGRDDFDIQILTDDSAIWEVLQHLVNVAREAGKPIEVCGSLADLPEFIPRLIELGFTSVSTYCENIGIVRKAAEKVLKKTVNGD